MSYLPKWQLPLAGASAGLTSTGTNQATALALTQEVNVLGTVASGTGVTLPAGFAGREVSVFNRGLNDLLIYPPVGATINALAVNASFSLASGTGVIFKYGTSTTLYSVSVVAGTTYQATDWVAYTPTVSGLGSGGVSAVDGRWRRVGDSIELDVYFNKDATAGSGAAPVIISFPAGITLETAKIAYGAATFSGTGFISGPPQGMLVAQATEFNDIRFVDEVGELVGADIAVGAGLYGHISFPVVGWTSF